MWSNSRGQMYRLCPHGFQHPDPDDMGWRRSLGFYTDAHDAWWLRHLCDDCCPGEMQEVLVD